MNSRKDSTNKRKRVASTSHPTAKKSKLDKTTAIEDTSFYDAINNPFPYHVVPHLPTTSLVALSSTSRVFLSLCDDELIWRDRYITQFGMTPHFKEDYKAQYIAEYLVKRFTNHTHDEDEDEDDDTLDTLIAHLDNFNEKMWTLYYRSMLADSDDMSFYAFKALSAGEMRSGFLTIQNLNYKVSKLKPINDDLDEMKKLLQQHEKDTEALQLIFLFNCISEKIEAHSGNNYNWKKTALNSFFSLLDPNDNNVKSFVDFAFQFFNIMSMQNYESHETLEYEPFSKARNVIDAAIIYINTVRMITITNLFYDWIKKIADDGHPTAAYYFAEHKRVGLFNSLSSNQLSLLSPTTDILIKEASYYYLKAFENGENRALCTNMVDGEPDGGLRDLISLKHEASVVSEGEMSSLLERGIKRGDINCLVSRADHACFEYKKKIVNFNTMWIIQLSASIKDKWHNDNYQFLVKEARYRKPETSLLIHCALTFVYALRNDDLKKSQQEYDWLTAVDPTLFMKYVEAGRKLGFCNAACEIVVTRFTNKPKPVEIKEIDDDVSSMRMSMN